MAYFQTDELNAWVAQIGGIMGLLVDNGDGTTGIVDEWFEAPWANGISRIPNQPGPVLALCDHILSSKQDPPPSLRTTAPGGAGLSWYPVPLIGGRTGTYFVLSDPSASAETGYAGLGLSTSFVFPAPASSGQAAGAATETSDSTGIAPPQSATAATISLSAFLPALRLDEADGGDVVLCGADTPAEIAAAITLPGALNYNDMSFDTVQVVGTLALGEGAAGSGLCLNFLDTAEDGTAERVATFTTLADALEAGAFVLVNEALEVAAVDAWLKALLSTRSTITPGLVFEALGLLKEPSDPSGSYCVDQDTLAALSTDLAEADDPAQALKSIALTMVFHGLELLASREEPLVPIREGGIYVTAVDGAGDLAGTTDYGINVRLPDFALGTVPADPAATSGQGDADTPATNPPADGANATQPQLTLQLGKWLTGEEGDTAWVARSVAQAGNPMALPDPGLSFLFVRQGPEDDDIHFHLGFALNSVGLDYIGTEAAPLVDIAGFVLGGVELRGEVAVDFDPGAQGDDRLVWSLGGAARCDGMGIPMGTGYDNTATQGDNVYAADMVSSGTGKGGNAATDQTDAVNPVFSASGAYVLGEAVVVQLYDENDAETETVWFPVQASFGPLFVKGLGIGWVNDTYTGTFTIDGGGSAVGLTVELIDLSLGIPFTSLTDLSTYDLGLEGASITFKEGPVALSGSLLIDEDNDPTDYEGMALVSAWRLSLQAMGAYTSTDDQPSMFFFGMLDVPLGGVPAFFIKGLSAGFGYNRSIALPDIDAVADYPLVAGLDGTDAMGTSPGEQVASMAAYIAPSRGEYWFAGGLKWTTYDIVNTDALFNVAFGNDFEIGLVGLSTVALPQATDRHFAYGELGVELVVDMGQGELIVAASLSPNSFVIDPNISVSGGFGMYAWWGDSPHAGDFVTSLGGYSSLYTPPAHYPVVNRLSFSYGASVGVLVSGDAYFALTTSNIMAGGEFDVVAHAIGCKMWFTGDADCILYWQPFYFEADMAVCAGASYTVSMFGASVSVGLEASGTFDVWSPEFGGDVAIDFWFIEVPISFGAAKAAPYDVVGWSDFAATNLPSAAPSSDDDARAMKTVQPDVDLIQIALTGGLVRTVESEGDTIWYVRPALFSFSTSSPVPVMALSLAGGEPVVNAEGTALGVSPMDAAITQSTHEISILDPDGTAMDSAAWTLSSGRTGLPTALWSPKDDGQPRVAPEMVPDVLSGAPDVRVAPHDALTGPPAFSILDALGYNDDSGGIDERWLPLDAAAEAATTGAPVRTPDTIQDIADTMAPDRVQSRSDIFAALAEMGIDAGADGALTTMAATPSGAFRAAPMALAESANGRNVT